MVIADTNKPIHTGTAPSMRTAQNSHHHKDAEYRPATPEICVIFSCSSEYILHKL
jgi:hypothetical protein